MPLSRLENFLKNAEGNILYVNPADFDATDSFENRGNSLTRPFRTIQRALIEAARFSYREGRNNDKIDTTTILVYPGTHYIDNRPGHSIQNVSGSAVFKKLVNGAWTTSGATLTEFDENSNFDIFDEDNDLYKYNSVEGGTILPRGTSIVGLDLRKTKIRPLYVPDPYNDNIENSAIFRVTGTCYFTAFTIFDADPSRVAYRDSTTAKVNPNFSHHKLTCFEYADGVNKVILDSNTTGLTDLEMYYYKITYAFGDTSGRGLPNFPVATGTDFEPSIDEYRIVGDLRSDAIGITSIKSGDGVVATKTISVKTSEAHGLFKDTPVLIAGITTNLESYNGSFFVADVLSDTEFTYVSPSQPTDPLPDVSTFVNSSVIVESDSTSSASPYIFSCTLRSVYGMNGLHADGSKATGFKSMLTAQFTGISLQKDDNAFILYDPETGIYNDNSTVADNEKPLHINSRAIYKPSYENVHMKASNNAIIQCVSIFAIGYAKHFVSESGGDQSITNSNSNFGAISLESSGFRGESFDRDDVGYITHVIPPREPAPRTSAVTWLPLDALKIVSAATTSRLYIANYKSADIPPPSQIDSYKVGGKRGEELYFSTIIGIAQSTFSSPVLMQVPSGISTSAEKIYTVGRSAGINSISSNIITLTSNHQLFNGEKVRIYSDTGELPSNVQNNKIYYALTNGVASNQIKLSSTLNDANSGNNITGISNGGGVITILSTVSDKNPGDAGHPIQYDTTERQWYVQSSPTTSTNKIYDAIVGIGTSVLGEVTGACYILRRVDNRGIDERIYRLRYVIPKEYLNARPPTDGFILQETKSAGIGSASFVSSNVEDPTQLKNPKIILDASYLSGTATIKTELPHNLVAGDLVKITNVVSSNNTTGSNEIPYNGSFIVNEVLGPREFNYIGLTSSPGTFLNQTNQRTTQQQIEALPTVQREKYKESIFIYRSTEIKKHIPGSDGQDGIYNLTAICGSIRPEISVGFGLSEKRFNQDVRNLYPQQDRDNFNSDPLPSTSFADLDPLGKISTNDKRLSITKEALNIFLENNRIGYAITGATVSGVGNTTITLYTNVEHGLNQIKSLSLINPGAGYNNSAGVTSTIYSADLVNGSINGEGASVKANISVGNTITSISLVNGGCAYGVGNTMTISASPAGSPTTSAVVQVTEIFDNVGDTLELSGFVNPAYNGIFRILSVPNSRSVQILNTGLGTDSSAAAYRQRTDSRYPIATLVSNGVGISTISYTKETGIATVTCLSAHGLIPGNTFKLVGTGSTFFSEKFFVNESVGINTFNFSAGISTISHTTSSSGMTVHKYGISANARALGAGEENLGGRGSYIYAGITTTLSGNISNTTTTLSLTSANGFKKGDYILINSEILRITSDPVGNSITVSRGQFSTSVSSALSGSSVRKIRVLPMEIRRHSILRASGHTFEYLGYGPGNYSTGLPVKQNRVLSEDEVLISQAREQDGGTVVYTGMNDRGEFYSGATKINGATGEETVIEAPIVTFFGEDETDTDVNNKLSGVFDDLVVKERITIEGGENNNQTSQFYGPVNFGQKVTCASEDGLETRDLFVKGIASQPKLITVGLATPTDPKKPGDISLLATPTPAGYIGHVYADGDWRRWGLISQQKDRNFLKFDQIGVGSSEGVYNFTDAAEVNGTLKVKNLYVGGAVTFASNQAFTAVTYEDITVTNQINYAGTGSSTYTIRHPDATSIAQFQNIEVTGTAATFTTARVRLENSLNSVFAGVSTFAGTVEIGNLVCSAGILTVFELRGNQIGIDTITVRNNAFITSGIVTNLYTNVSSATSFFGYVGVITSLTGLACTFTNVNGTNGFLSGLRATSSFATPNAFVNVGVTTTLSGTSLTYTRSSIGLATITNLNSTDWIGAPTAYINSGLVTAITANYIGGGLGGNPLSISVNSGVITSLTGTAATFTSVRASSSLVSNDLVSSPVGVITALSGDRANYTGIVTAQRYESTVATGAPPIVVASTTKVTNLNADLLDGLDESTFLRRTNDVWHTSQDGDNRFYFTTDGKTLYGSANGHEFRDSTDSASFIINNDGTVNFSSTAVLSVNGITATTYALVDKVILKNYAERLVNVGNTGSAATLNLADGNFFAATLNANCTFTFSLGVNNTSATSFTLLLTNDGTSGRSIVWPASVKWPNSTVPTRTTSANRSDVYTFFTTNGGANWYGALALYNYA
jgi:hypothetical protein